MTNKNVNLTKISAWALVDKNNRVVLTTTTRESARNLKDGDERIVKLKFEKFAR